MNRLSRLLRPALLVAVLTLLMGAVVQAAGSATIRDDAGLFTSAGRSAIERAAEQNNVRVVVITDRKSFPSERDWHAWLRSQATDPNAITIGLHAVPGQKRISISSMARRKAVSSGGWGDGWRARYSLAASASSSTRVLMWVPPRLGTCGRASDALRWHPTGADPVRREEGTMTRPKPPEGATARITIVLPVEALERVKERAEEIATPPSVLIRQWIMEHTRRVPAQGGDAGR